MKFFYEDVLKAVGEFGPWQVKMIFFLWVPMFMCGMKWTTTDFMGLEHRSSSVNTMAALTIKRPWWKGTSRTSWRTTRTSSPTPRSTTERTRPPLLRSCPSTLKRKSLRRTWISVEVDDFKDANEALENQVEVCNDDFEDEDLKALEDEDEGQRINAFDAVYLSPSTLSSNGFLS